MISCWRESGDEAGYRKEGEVVSVVKGELGRWNMLRQSWVWERCGPSQVVKANF